jgi:hypothetical protein
MLELVLQKLNIAESQLPARLRILFVKAKIGLYGELLLKNEIIHWYAKSKVEKKDEKDIVVNDVFQVAKIIQHNASKGEDIPYLEDVRNLEHILPTEILRMEFRHNIEIIEKLILERKKVVQDVKEEIISRATETTPDVNAYKMLLEKNMQLVIRELNKINEDTNQAINACLTRNSTSVFKYSYENGQLVGKIDNIIEQKSDILFYYKPEP